MRMVRGAAVRPELRPPARGEWSSILQDGAIDRGVRLSGGTIPAGGSCTVTADFTATTQAANTPVTYTNSISAGAGMSATRDRQAGVATILVADTLRVLKTNASAPRPGNPVPYAITVQNWTAADLNNVRVLDPLATGMTFLTGTINGVDYTPTMSGAGCSGPTAPNATGDANCTSLSVPCRNAPTSAPPAPAPSPSMP